MAHLPGQQVSIHNDEWGTTCDYHPDREAVTRICTESDSFGSEYMNLCQECLDAHERAKEEIRNDESQWETCKCGNKQPQLVSFRDIEEGSHGPVYQRCSDCYNKYLSSICDDDDDDDDYYYYD